MNPLLQKDASLKRAQYLKEAEDERSFKMMNRGTKEAQRGRQLKGLKVALQPLGIW